MTAPESPAEVLRRAAEKLRASADLAVRDGASVLPWREAEAGNCKCCNAVRDATGALVTFADDRQSGWIATAHPGVGLALAALLEREASLLDAALEFCVLCGQHVTACQCPGTPLGIARAILGESETEGERQ